jgi:Holliday junction resolvase RusA-like endonuclease
MILHIPIAPMAYKRARAKGGQFYVPKDYQDWKAEAGMLMRNQMKLNGVGPSEGPTSLRIHVGSGYIEVDAVDTLSISHRRKLRGDLDNYIKAILDAGNGVLYEDDKQVEWINGGFV